MKDLISWKNNSKRKPLLLYGARQVGKTYLIKEFGKSYYENTIYVNFETNLIAKEIIETDIDPKNIIKQLEIIFNQRILKEKTLIIFDEIQENPRALTSLKYFYENEPDYHIIGAGSLLGVHIKRKNYSFPVGKVDSLTIHPMDFEEFLIVTENEFLVDEIKRCFHSDQQMNKLLHEKALTLYNDYLTLGGMPEVIDVYLKENSMISAIDIQSKIISDYKNDITKYAESNNESNKIIATFDSIPNQLAKDNKKFQYKLVKKGGSSSIFGDSIHWLVNAGITMQCYKTKIGVPLKMFEQLESFKLYMNDVGLLTNLSNFPIYLINNREAANEMMIGMLTENYVASNFKFNGLNLHYWQSEYDAKIDFILQSKKGNIIPVEVKSKTNTHSRSLNSYINEFEPKYSIRISQKNFGFENNIKSVPLYAVFCITEDSLDDVE